MEFVLFPVMLRASLLRLFSVALLGRFYCANESTQPEADKQKRTMALFIQYYYKREAYCEKTV